MHHACMPACHPISKNVLSPGQTQTLGFSIHGTLLYSTLLFSSLPSKININVVTYLPTFRSLPSPPSFFFLLFTSLLHHFKIPLPTLESTLLCRLTV